MSVDQKLRKLEEEMDKKPRTSLRASMGERQAARLTDARKQSLFNMLDVHGNGTINADEFNELYEAMKAETEQELAKEQALLEKAARSKRRMKLLGCFAAAMGVFLAVSVAANFSVTLGLLEATKDTRTASNGALEVTDGSGQIAKTAAAEQSIPLFVVPVLPDEQLFAISSTAVSYYSKELYEQGDGGNLEGYMMHSLLNIAEVRKYNSTFVELLTFVPGRTLTILNGKAFILDVPTGDNGLLQAEYSPVCASNVTCSSLTVAGADVDGLTSLAVKELAKAGVVQRRRLQQSASGLGCEPGFHWSLTQFPATGIPADWDNNGNNNIGFASVASSFYSGYQCSVDVVFLFHGHGGQKGVYWIGGLMYRLRQLRYRHMYFVYPTSAFSSTPAADEKHSCSAQTTSPAKGCNPAWQAWPTFLGNGATYDKGLNQVGTFLDNWDFSHTGSESFRSGGVGSSTRVFATGHSDGGALAVMMSLSGVPYSGYSISNGVHDSNSFGPKQYHEGHGGRFLFSTASTSFAGVPFGYKARVADMMPTSQPNTVDLRFFYAPDDFSFVLGLTPGGQMITSIAGLLIGPVSPETSDIKMPHRAPFRMDKFGPENHRHMLWQRFKRLTFAGQDGNHRVILDQSFDSGPEDDNGVPGKCNWAGFDAEGNCRSTGTGVCLRNRQGLASMFPWLPECSGDGTGHCKYSAEPRLNSRSTGAAGSTGAVANPDQCQDASGRGGGMNCCNGLSNRFGWFYDRAVVQKGKPYHCNHGAALPGMCAHMNVGPLHGALYMVPGLATGTASQRDWSDFAVTQHDETLTDWMNEHPKMNSYGQPEDQAVPENTCYSTSTGGGVGGGNYDPMGQVLDHYFNDIKGIDGETCEAFCNTQMEEASGSSDPAREWMQCMENCHMGILNDDGSINQEAAMQTGYGAYGSGSGSGSGGGSPPPGGAGSGWRRRLQGSGSGSGSGTTFAGSSTIAEKKATLVDAGLDETSAVMALQELARRAPDKVSNSDLRTLLDSQYKSACTNDCSVKTTESGPTAAVFSSPDLSRETSKKTGSPVTDYELEKAVKDDHPDKETTEYFDTALTTVASKQAGQTFLSPIVRQVRATLAMYNP